MQQNIEYSLSGTKWQPKHKALIKALIGEQLNILLFNFAIQGIIWKLSIHTWY